MQMKFWHGILILGLFGFFITAGCSSPSAQQGTGTASQAAGKYIDVTPEKGAILIESEPEIIIVDLSGYYDDGHITGATSLPLETLDNVILSMDKTKTYFVYSHDDSSSISGATKFVNAGFPRVYRLAGNYDAWVEAGNPVS